MYYLDVEAFNREFGLMIMITAGNQNICGFVAKTIMYDGYIAEACKHLTTKFGTPCVRNVPYCNTLQLYNESNLDKNGEYVYTPHSVISFLTNYSKHTAAQIREAAREFLCDYDTYHGVLKRQINVDQVEPRRLYLTPKSLNFAIAHHGGLINKDQIYAIIMGLAQICPVSDIIAHISRMVCWLNIWDFSKYTKAA